MNSLARATASLLVLLGAGSSLAQDPPPQPPAPPAAEAGEQADAPPSAAERPDVEDDEFIPTEELNPDAAVTFPVDI